MDWTEKAREFRKNSMTWEFAQGRNGEMYSREEVGKALASFASEVERLTRQAIYDDPTSALFGVPLAEVRRLLQGRRVASSQGGEQG